MWFKILVACLACQVTKNKATFRQIPLSKEYGIFKVGDSIGMQRGGRSESGGKSFQTVVEQHKLFSDGKEEAFNNIEHEAEKKIQENTGSTQERFLNIKEEAYVEDLYLRNIVEIPSSLGMNQQRGTFGKLVAGGLGLASGYYLANKLSNNRPNYGSGYDNYRPTGYGERPGYGRPNSYGYSSRPNYQYRPNTYGYSPGPNNQYKPNSYSQNAPYFQRSSFEEVSVDESIQLAKMEEQIMENEDLYLGNIVELPSNYGLNQQRGTFGKLVLGGLGLASGYYLANKLSNQRPNYNQGYTPYQHGYQGYHGYPQRPVYPYTQYQRSNGDSSLEELLSKSEEEIFENQQRGTFGKLVAGGLGLASGYYLANKLSNNRPSYAYGNNQYRPTGYGGRPVYGQRPHSYGYSSKPDYNYRPNSYSHQRSSATTRTYAIANIIENQETLNGIDYSKVTQQDFGCLPVYSFSYGGVPYFGCKGKDNGQYIQQLVFNPKPYGWSVPYQSNGLGSNVDAYIPVGSL